MGRPLIEFLISDRLPWVEACATDPFPGASKRVLSRDEETGAESALYALPEGYSRPSGRLAASCEVFVLEGALAVDTIAASIHHYFYFPYADEPRISAPRAGGARVLAYSDGLGEAGEEGGPVEIDTTTLRWDRSKIDPNINHLEVARKNLRFDPKGRRTYLLAGMPQGFPPGLLARKERHPHVEEFFIVSGEIACSLVGTMRQGDYFWRPPGVWHGLDSSRAGFLMFCRTPGSNVTISEWSEETFPIDPDPPYRPALPPDLAAAMAPAKTRAGA